MNFGKIKDTFSQLMVESYVNNKGGGKKLYKKFLKALNEDEILKTQFIVYKNIEKTNNMEDLEVHDYLKENISLFNGFDKDTIIKSNNKLEKLLEGRKISKGKKIYSDINKLIVLEKKATTINKLQESFIKVKEFIKENKEVIDLGETKTKIVDPKKFLSIAVEKYNDRYKEELTEEETKIVQTLRKGSQSEKENLLQKYIKETITLVNKQLVERKDNITLKETLLGVKDMIYNTLESSDLKESVIKLYDLKKNLL